RDFHVTGVQTCALPILGGECDFIEDELIQLNQADEEEVAFFCWAGLRQINDGQIAPALWLNALGNVYVIQRQRQDCKSENRVFKIGRASCREGVELSGV